MINRNALICTGCDAKIVTRVAIGHGAVQEHTFPCPRCGVDIRIVLDLDQEKIDFSYREPTNARWADDEDGAIKVLTFDAESMVPGDLEDFFSPFLATIHNLTDPEAYQRDEGFRRAWRSRFWPVVERLVVHLDRGNDDLFDREAARISRAPDPATRAGRLALLGSLLERGLNWFTVDRPADRRLIRQRLALAESVSPTLFAQLATEYEDTGRLNALWRELNAVRRDFVKSYPDLSSVLQMWYWHPDHRVAGRYVVSAKAFDSLRQLYVDSFETLCRLVVLGVALEEIIHRSSLGVETRKGEMSLWDFEAMPNGSKADIIRRFPIGEVFIPVMNHKLRNGIGHNSAYYDRTSDSVVYDELKAKKVVERRMSYTKFCEELLKVLSALEVAALYHHSIHLNRTM